MLIKLIKPYTRINITFISGELNIDPADVESLLVSCILDNTVRGRIDQVSVNIMMVIELLGLWVAKAINVKDPVAILVSQVTGVLELDRGGEGSARYQALDKWNNQLNNLQKLVINKMA